MASKKRKRKEGRPTIVILGGPKQAETLLHLSSAFSNVN